MTEGNERMTSMRLNWGTKTALDAIAIELQEKVQKRVSSESVIRFLISEFRPDIAEKYGIVTTVESLKQDKPKNP